MAVLEPKLAILDETDSGLDIDALKIVAGGVTKLRRPDNSAIVITHYQRLLNYIVPDFVHVLAEGRSSNRAARNWRSNWKNAAMTGFWKAQEQSNMSQVANAANAQTSRAAVASLSRAW